MDAGLFGCGCGYIKGIVAQRSEGKKQLKPWNKR